MILWMASAMWLGFWKVACAADELAADAEPLLVDIKMLFHDESLVFLCGYCVFIIRCSSMDLQSKCNSS